LGKGFLRVIYTTINEGHASTIFTRVYTKFKAQKSILVHGFTQRDYTPGKISHFNYTSSEEKNGVNKTANSENIFKTGHLSNNGRPFDLSCHSEINTRQLFDFH